MYENTDHSYIIPTLFLQADSYRIKHELHSILFFLFLFSVGRGHVLCTPVL